jgi:hypothetical protein
MNNPYDLHSYSMHYREERLAEASRRHLVNGLRVSREKHSGWGRVSLAWANMLSFLSGA